MSGLHMLFGYLPNSSPVPVIGLVDALARLMDKLPIADVTAEKESLDRALEALGLPESDPHGVDRFDLPALPATVNALLRAAPMHWMRHEAGIKRLGDALNTGKLHLALRYVDGRLVQLPSDEWRASPYQREIMTCGRWRDEEWRPSQDRHRHGECEAVLIESEFDAWCSRFLEAPAEEPASPSLELPPTLEPASPIEPWELIQQVIAEELGSRLITPTMPGRQRDIQKRDNCVPVCHSGLRHV